MLRDRSGVVDDDAVDFVGDVLELIHHPLEILENLAGDGELKRIGSGRLESTLEARGASDRPL
jgi:hypothetical protein